MVRRLVSNLKLAYIFWSLQHATLSSDVWCTHFIQEQGFYQ